MQVNHAGRFPAALTLVLAIVASAASAAPADKSQATPAPLEIQPEPLSVKPGDPMSPYALVAKPPIVSGALSWTIESRRHRGVVLGSAISPDGQQLATGGMDASVRIWNLATGELTAVFLGHTYCVYSVAWHPSGTVLASAGWWDGMVKLWDPKSKRLLRTFKVPKHPTGHVAWSPDGTRLVASSGSSGIVWLWDSRTNETRTAMEIGTYVSGLFWSPDSKFLAVCGSQYAFSVHDMEKKSEIHALGMEAPNERFTTVAWSPDSKQLCAGSREGASLFDLESGKILRKYAGACLAAAWSPDGNLMALSYGGAHVNVWSPLSNEKPVTRLPAGSTDVFWHDKTQELVCVSRTEAIVWNGADYKRMRTLDLGALTPPVWTANRPVVSGLGTSNISLWDVGSGELLRRLDKHPSIVHDAAWSRDGKILATACNDKLIRLWDGTSGKLLRTLTGHKVAPTMLSWSPNASMLASAGAEPTVRLWNVDNNAADVLEGNTKNVRALAWSPAGNLVASGGYDKEVRMWDVKTHKTVRTIRAFQVVESLAFAAMGKTLTLAVGTSDEVILLFNASTGQQLGGLRHRASPPNVSALAWLPARGQILVGRACHLVQHWDVSQNKVLHNMRASGPAQYVTAASNGNTLVAANFDRTVRFWNAGDGQLQGSVVDEGNCIAMISADGYWRADPGEKPDLIYVVQTPETQLTLKPDEFATQCRFKNNPARVKFPPR